MGEGGRKGSIDREEEKGKWVTNVQLFSYRVKKV